MRHIAVLGLPLIFFGASTAVNASCGAAFCSLNSGMEAQDVGTDRGALFDLRYEYIDQNTPRSGDSRLNVGEVTAHHDEVRTRNNNVVATFDYAFNSQWGFTARLPYVDRQHEHIHHHTVNGERRNILEQWHLTGLGDAQLTGRYAFRRDMLGTNGIRVGLKLPTGKYHETNAEGAEAERSLQPGSGTTDFVVSAYFARSIVPNRWSSFGQFGVQTPMTTRDQFQPGKQLTFDYGLRYSLSSHTTALAQINTLFKWHDRGDQAEPNDSGGRYVFFSPGVSHALPHDWQIYAYTQLPLHQYVNGIQLTAKWTAIAGLSRRF